jgi:hypothetical protein
MMATGMATIAVMATTAAITTATTATAAAIAAAAATENKGRSLVLAADEGNAHQGEEHRQTKHNDTIHPQILQLLTGTVSGNYKICRPVRLIAAPSTATSHAM